MKAEYNCMSDLPGLISGLGVLGELSDGEVQSLMRIPSVRGPGGKKHEIFWICKGLVMGLDLRF